MESGRSEPAIIMDILGYIQDEGGEAPATRIAQATGLAYDGLVKILEELNEKGLVVVNVEERARRVRITRNDTITEAKRCRGAPRGSRHRVLRALYTSIKSLHFYYRWEMRIDGQAE